MPFKLYLKLLYTHPWKTQLIGSGFLLGIGDVSSQILVERKAFKDMELIRIARFCFLGCFYVGPTSTYLYKFMEMCSVFKSLHKGLAVMKRVAFDQIVFAPVSLSVFMVLNGVLQAHSMKEIVKTHEKDFMDIYRKNVLFWTCVQTVNFYFLPLLHRVLFAKSVAVFWNTYLAWKLNREGVTLDVEVAAEL